MTTHKQLANAIRFLSIDAVQKANSGHPGMPMGMADVATVLLQKHLKFYAQEPHWHSRDRLILSAGHGSMLQYALLYLTGYPEMSIEDLQSFRQFGSKTAGHPEYGHLAGIETTTGPLGQGLATAVGIALAERMLGARFGALYNHRTYVIAGDGCLMEGISQEAISMAGHWQLGKLIVLFDDNSISIDGKTDLAVSEDTDARFRSAGWRVLHADAHNPDDINEALTHAKATNDAPVMIRCTSIIGYGSPNKQGTEGAHGAPLGAEEIAITRKHLDWPYVPFELPEDLLNTWRNIGKQGKNQFDEWNQALAGATEEIKAQWQDYFVTSTQEHLGDLLLQFKQTTSQQAPTVATRKASETFLHELATYVPNLIGGSADLTHSNFTYAKGMSPINANNFAGNYVYYGVREHGMGAVLNGLVLSGGLKAYGGTFFVFTDYCRPAIRLSALMQLPVVYVMTHDSIGLGEDGPTHQPIEHLNAFRAMPNLLLMRPADVLETAECWIIAISQTNRPTILALSRQGLPCLQNTDLSKNNSAQGAYLVFGDTHARDITIISSGSEVSLALDVARLLAEHNIQAAIISMPSSTLFDEMPIDYQNTLLGDKPIFAIEAGSSLGWYKYVGRHPERIFAVDSFGVSAPAQDAYRHFGLQADIIAENIQSTYRTI